jgi:hypothetical protein
MMTDNVLLDRDQVLESLRDLPVKVSSEDLIERILFIKLIEERLLEDKEVPNSIVMQELQDLRRSKLATLQPQA